MLGDDEDDLLRRLYARHCQSEQQNSVTDVATVALPTRAAATVNQIAAGAWDRTPQIEENRDGA